MKRILGSAIPYPVTALVLWTGGFDFDNRNPGLAYVFLIVIFISVMIYTLPGWKK